MDFCIKKSFRTLFDNPHIMLLFVTYLLAFSGLISAVVFVAGKPLFYVAVILIFLLTCAFFAGWLGMIKCLVAFKETDNAEENLKNKYTSFSIGFFSSVANYILPVIFYFILFMVFIRGLLSLASNIFNGSIETAGHIAALMSNQDALLNYLSTLPDNELIALVKFNAFVYFGILLYLFLTFYAIPSVYFNEKTANPLSGLKNGFLSLCKKPFYSAGIFLILLFSHVILVFFEKISFINPVLMFIALVLRVSFIAYVIVLIFSVYEKNFTDNGNNGTDRIRENEPCN